MSKIKIEFVEEFGLGDGTRAAVELEGDSSTDHWLKAIVGAMTLAGYAQETIMEMLDPCDAHCAGFGGTCCDDDETRCPAGCCGPDDELDLGPELVTDEGPNVARPVIAAEADRIAGAA